MSTSTPYGDVYIAAAGSGFYNTRANSLPGPRQSNGTWTNITNYVEELRTKTGKQHYLDRIEASSLSVTLNNRDGTFWNTLGISVRTPIAVTSTLYTGSTTSSPTGTLLTCSTATWAPGAFTGLTLYCGTSSATITSNTATTISFSSWTGGTPASGQFYVMNYNVFFGFIDSIEEKLIDQQNSELVVTASDALKYLSMRRMASSTFWPTYAKTANSRRWYRLTNTPSANVTAGVATSSTSVTYTAINTFKTGQQVSISGLGTFSGTTLNMNNATITGTPTSTSFTVTVPSGTTVTSGSTSSGTGVAFRTSATDLGSDNSSGTLVGAVSFQQNGAMIYDADNCIDLANGSTTGSGALAMPQITTANPAGSIDFWVLGNNLAGNKANNFVYLYAFYVTISGSPVECYLGVTYSGLPYININGNTATGSVPINDGYWHHVGVANYSGALALYADGQFFTVPGVTATSFHSNGQVNYIGYLSGAYNCPMYLDEVVVGSTTVQSTELTNRYRAGSLLQLGFPVTSQNVPGTSSNMVSSGDRIAEILCLSGWGSIVNGVVLLTNNQYFINGSGTAWSASTSNGAVATEPYYWDSPVTQSNALDLIFQVCDTDIGTFFQRPDGTFNYNNSNFFGTWTWNATTQTGTWAPKTYTSDNYHTWTDADGTNTPYYGPSTQILYDDTDLWTVVGVTPQSGVEQIYENSSGQTTYGITVLEKSSTLHTTLDSAMSTAHYIGWLYHSPLARAAAVELRGETGNGYWNRALLQTSVGDVVTFNRIFPGQTTGTSSQMVVESISHQFLADPGIWRTTFILDPYPVRGGGSA